jgi:hypothetical protein
MVAIRAGEVRSGSLTRPLPTRASLDVWRELEAPYQAARVRVLIALASRAVGVKARPH